MNADLEKIWALMRAAGSQLPTNPTVEQMRAFANGANASLPLSPGVSFTDVDEKTTDGNRVKGIWSQNAPTDSTTSANKTILYFHGGGYFVGTASSWRGLSGELGRLANMRVFSVEYRLAPEHKFPAAAEDGLTAYRWLLGQGIAAGSIAVAGDSAGGALALATLFQARTAGLPMPGAAFLIAPWVDHTWMDQTSMDDDLTGRTIVTKAAVELLAGPDMLRGMSSMYLQGHSKADPLVSPLQGDMTGLPPMIIQVGSEETLLDDSVRLAGKAGAAKVKVHLEIYPDCFHVFHTWHSLVPEAREALGRAAAFLSAHIS